MSTAELPLFMHSYRWLKDLTDVAHEHNEHSSHDCWLLISVEPD